MCLFSKNKDAYRPIRVFYLGSKEQRYYSSSKKKKKKKVVLQYEAETQHISQEIWALPNGNTLYVILQDLKLG